MKQLIAVFLGLLLVNLFAGNSNGQDFFFNQKMFNRSIDRQNSLKQLPTADLRTKFDNFISRANENGNVRVIIGLRLENYKSDAEMNGFKQAAQRAEIKEKQTAILSSLSNFSVINAKQFEYLPFLAMEIGADALIALRDSPDIVSLEEDAVQTANLLQSIPLIGGNAAGTFGGFSGSGRTVAILDSGVDKTHPFFNNRVVSEACYSTNNATMTSYCPGGASSSTASGSGLHCNISQIEGCFHGTHVAGIAAGGNPSLSGSGVARNAGIIAIQVFSRSTDCGQETSPCNRSTVSDTVLGLERVYALRTTFNIDAVNMSLGGGQYTSYCDTEQTLYKTAIDNLRAAGIASVVSSGNSGYPNALSAPACISTAISVGSTHDGSVGLPDNVSDFSNSASFLNLLAPGELITSAYPGGSYYDTQGTSQAAPHVAGAFAVVKQKFPTDTVTQVLTRLRYGGVLVYDPDNGTFKPRIKVDTALNTSNVDPCSSSTPISSGQTLNGTLAPGDCLIPPGRTDLYSFSATQGQTVAITETSTAFDSYVLLFNSAGALIAQDNNGGGGTNSRIPATSGFLTIPATGTYYIYAASLGQISGNYSVNLVGGTSCNFTVSSSGQSFSASGGSGNFNVTTAAGCAWTAQSNAAWLTTTSTGNGNGTVNYAVSANTSSAERTATINVSGQIHTVTQAGTAATVTHRPFDFDGDSKTDISIFRPSLGEWWYSKSSNGGNAALQFGTSTDKLMPADFTGDGKTDIAFWRPSTGFWFILRSEDFSFFSFPFGAAGDVPVAADFDGDGRSDPGVFRPSTATWFISKSAGGTLIQTFGAAGDKPVIADYDGDGKADIAIFRPSTGEWWLSRSSGGVIATSFGTAADKPVPGDYTGDGRADIAFFRPSTGFWFILRSEDSSFFSFPFGAAGDVAVAGDYDGDGKTDAGVFRPSVSTWFINRTTAGVLITSFGASGDQPVPNVFVP